MSEAYLDFAARLRATGVLLDPWVDGAPRFRAEPLWLTRDELDALAAAAEAVAHLHDRLARLLLADPDALGALGLTPVQRLLWETSAPLWHGLARADVFRTEAGLRVCELNSDTPSGAPEAVLLGELCREAHPGAADPNRALAGRFCAALEALTARTCGADGALTIGLVYPTDIPEDLALVELYRRWLEARGHRVVLGSPYNLARAADGRASLFGAPCDAILRHYKTDWWTERRPAWLDEPPYPDDEPLAAPLAALLGAALERRTAIWNPTGAVVTQNKRALALLFELEERLEPEARAALHAFVPETRRMETMPRERLLDERDAWVLKSDYGCEGEEVLVGRHTPPEVWAKALELARPARFVVQRRFDPLEDADGASWNLGVYVIGGRAAGVYARAQAGATDRRALSVPVLVRGEGEA